MTYIFVPIKSPIYECTNCKYITANKKDFNKHNLTAKHLRLTKYLQNIPEIPIQEKIFICDCNKEYKHRQSLYTHKQKCNFIKENTNEEKDETNETNEEKDETNEEKDETNKDVNISDKNLILTIIQQNNELQKQMLEVIKNGTNNTTNINSHNKTFNLQVFLNETCKDAMNIMDFVDSIKIQLSDIESIGELGFVNGISKLIIKHLNALDENMRPIHCNDPKRDSLYVKDANVWEKEDPDNKKIKKAIKYISHKNICALMGGSGDNDAEKADKIVKKIAKVVTIDKNNL
jgi:hypothetical protein